WPREQEEARSRPPAHGEGRQTVATPGPVGRRGPRYPQDRSPAAGSITQRGGTDWHQGPAEAEGKAVSKHSPGPWHICGKDRGGCICGQIWSGPRDVEVCSISYREDGGEYIDDL